MGEEGNKTIIVVDNDVATGKIIEKFFKKAGYRVYFFSVPKEALRAINNEMGYVDVLLSDIRMPIMDGAELAEAVRIFSPGTIIILMSGDERESLEEKLSDCDAFFEKPVELAKLGKTLEKLLA